MVTAKQILDNSLKFHRDSKDVEFDSIEPARYDLAQKKLSFKGHAVGQSKKLYKVEVAFYEVDPDGLTPDQLAAGIVPKPKDLLDHPVKVDCECYDYMWNGALRGNLKHGCALYTHKDFTTYEKKTDAAPKNPDEIPYGCKHIVSFIYDIMAALEDANKGE